MARLEDEVHVHVHCIQERN